jgi:hypothetical protein
MGLETLLSLDGEIFPMDNGFWTRFEIKKIEPSEQAPHGIKYSLTLHDRDNHRIFGIDNAHAFKPKRKKFGARRMAWDHQHLREKVTPYEFESPERLLEYFWNEVDRVIKNKRT